MSAIIRKLPSADIPYFPGHVVPGKTKGSEHRFGTCAFINILI